MECWIVHIQGGKKENTYSTDSKAFLVCAAQSCRPSRIQIRESQDKDITSRSRYVIRALYCTDIKQTKCSPASGTGRLASQPSVWSLLVLTTGKPLAHTFQTPHGSTKTLNAFWWGSRWQRNIAWRCLTLPLELDI